MRRRLAWVVLAVLLIGAACLAPTVSAQQGEAAAEGKAAEFARLYERWQQAQDPEEKIALGGQLLAIEPGLKEWPLTRQRQLVRGDLLVGLGVSSGLRSQGSTADNQEKAIAYIEAALTAYTRDPFPGEWALTQNALARAYDARAR